MIQFDKHVFEMGWFNHQLDKYRVHISIYRGYIPPVTHFSGNFNRLKYCLIASWLVLLRGSKKICWGREIQLIWSAQMLCREQNLCHRRLGWFPERLGGILGIHSLKPTALPWACVTWNLRYTHQTWGEIYDIGMAGWLCLADCVLASETRSSRKRDFIFQPSIFGGKLLVSGRLKRFVLMYEWKLPQIVMLIMTWWYHIPYALWNIYLHVP